MLGVSDAFIVPIGGAWQPFIELSEGRERWALERRATMEEAQAAARHFLGTLADAVSHAAQAQGPLTEKDPEFKALHAPAPPTAPGEEEAAEAVLTKARRAREASGWELIAAASAPCAKASGPLELGVSESKRRASLVAAPGLGKRGSYQANAHGRAHAHEGDPRGAVEAGGIPVL